ncbi:MAG: biopolymer transporter ExbD [Leptospiraceae bacterium]|nr:biopolymer transporter ExbD [Leptospiraceae bacterium]
MHIKRNSRTVEEIPLASTADIAFLLIVFFLAASALLEMRGVRIPVPKKDAPPMEILKKNIYQIDIDAEGQITHEKESLPWLQILSSANQESRKNKDLVVLIKVNPEAPVDVIPKVIQGLQDESIQKISVSMEK